MATKDNINSGLLSKVAKFVRNPTTNWTDLDKQDAEPDNGYSKQALKEMIERKRQNDFVRKREFDQLRKLRNRDPSAGNPDLAGRPSYFQSSLPSNPGERASTIKKIDEIEAQMSNQWWQGRTDTAKPAAAGSADAAAKGSPGWPEQAAPVALPPRSGASVTDISYAATRLATMPEATGAEESEFMPTQLVSMFGAAPAPARAKPPAPPRPSASHPEPAASANSQSFGVKTVEAVNDGDLEEAAIRFANGDNGGAEAALLEALKADDLRRDQIEICSAALFDLYRATGQQQRFDSVAITFAERFGRSAPAWFSMPEMLGLKAAGSTARTIPLRLQAEPIWSSPAEFGAAAVDELELALANAPSPWFLDWSQMSALEDDAVEPLGRVFSQWAARPVHLRFRGPDNLDRVLRAGTPPGKNSVRQACWRLRMDALRVMGQQDDFELVALEYCVTFEVSPPAWQDVRCAYVPETSGGALAGGSDKSDGVDADEEDTAPEAMDSLALTMPMGYDSSPAAVVELAGEIMGEATDALARLEDARQGGARLVISCANLIRVDFSAAGSILNWVAARQSEGCHVQFREVHRLVAAFFHVIGIHEHARVVLRSN